MVRTAQSLLVLVAVLAASVSAPAQGLLGEHYVGAAFDIYWEGESPSYQGVSAVISFPFETIADLSLAGAFVPGEEVTSYDGWRNSTRTTSDTWGFGATLTFHGDASGTAVPYLAVTLAPTFRGSYGSFSATGVVGLEFVAGTRVAVRPNIGYVSTWIEERPPIGAVGLGLDMDIRITEKAFLMLGISRVNLLEDEYNADDATTASVGIGMLL